MAEVKTWTVYPTWCVYPRVQFFRNRFLSLQPRFERIAGSVQWKVKYFLEAIQVWFGGDLEIKVITESGFPTERFIVDRKSLPDNTKQPPDSDNKETKKSRVYVCFIEGQGVRDPLFIQSLKDVLDFYNKETPSTENILYIAVKLIDGPSDEECKLLQNDLEEQLAWRPLSWDKFSSVVFVKDHTDLPVAISDYFEQQLVEGISVIAKCLKSFIPREAYCRRDTKNLKAHLKAFSEKSNAPKSIAFIILDLPMPSVADDWKRELDGNLHSLARMIKCQVLLPFYEELLIPPDVYHDILVKSEYESKFVISSSTKNLLLDKKNLVITEGACAFLKYTHPDIVKAIIEDVCPLVEAIEVEYDHRSKICTKMLYEINKYMEQSPKFGEQICGLMETPYIPKGIRQRVLGIKGVYCIGTVYNQFTVLLDQINDDKRVGDIRFKIDQIMRRHGCDVPCVIKNVKKPPSTLVNIQYENGNVIRAATTGTVGAFVKDVRGRKYALTCAHLLGDGERPRDVFIKDSHGDFNLFARSSPDLTVGFAETPCRLIDITALIVNNDFEQLCETSIKDEDGFNRPWRSLDSHDNSIMYCNVYKYGGSSNLTTGFVVSSDIELPPPADIELPPPALLGRILQDPSYYLIMIDNLPGSDESENPFSARGDSGSVVCKTRLVNNVRLMNHGDEPRVTAISMIHCGELQIDGEEESDLTISFRLKTGLELISEKSGMEFVQL